MAIDGYLHGAISQLQTALDALQAQIRDLQHTEADQKHHLQQEIDHLKQERRFTDAEMLKMHEESELRLVHERANQIQRTEDARRNEIAQMDTNLQHLVQRKMQLYNDMHRILEQLNALLSSPDIR